MKTAAIIGVIVAIAIVVGVVSTVASTPSIDSPESDVISEAENKTGKFIIIELDEAISAKAKP